MVSLHRRYLVALIAAVLLASALVAWLSVRQIQLNQAYAELRRLATQPHEGYAVPGFLARTLSGDTVTIGEGGSESDRTLLFVFTTTCPYCLATLPVWQQLADSAAGVPNVRIVALVLDSAAAARRYVAAHGLRFPVATFSSEKLRRLYRAGSVPQTVVLDGEGTVVYATIGRLKPGPQLDSVYAGLIAHSAKRIATRNGDGVVGNSPK